MLRFMGSQRVRGGLHAAFICSRPASLSPTMWPTHSGGLPGRDGPADPKRPLLSRGCTAEASLGGHIASPPPRTQPPEGPPRGPHYGGGPPPVLTRCGQVSTVSGLLQQASGDLGEGVPGAQGVSLCTLWLVSGRGNPPITGTQRLAPGKGSLVGTDFQPSFQSEK